MQEYVTITDGTLTPPCDTLYREYHKALGVLGEPGEQGHVEGETVGDEVRGAVQTGAAQVRHRHHGLLTCTLYLAALFIGLQVSGAMVYSSQLWNWQPLCS